MSVLAEYVLGVTAAAMLAAIACSMCTKGTMGALIKMIAGLIVAMTVLAPLVRIQLPDWREWSAAFAVDGEAAAAAGEEMARQAQASIIIGQVEAYIEDKAAAFGVHPEVTVRLDAEGVPTGVVLCGDVPPGVKEKLTGIIAEDLGIGKEDQEWIS